MLSASLNKTLPFLSTMWIKEGKLLMKTCYKPENTAKNGACQNVCHQRVGRKEGIVLFNDTLNTFYLRLYGVRHMVKDHSDSEREENCCCHMGYFFRLAASVLLYASSHRQDSTYHSLCYTSHGALAGTRNSSMAKELVPDILQLVPATNFVNFFQVKACIQYIEN